MKVVSSLLVLLLPVFAFAGLEEDFNALRDSGSKYEIIGTVCEQVSKLRMQEQFPQPEFTVETGIAYGDAKRTIGELDVIVFENKSHNAVKIAEVKCWKDMRGGLNKAHDQRQRFLKTMSSKKEVSFQSTEDGQEFSASQFRGAKNFISIAQKGSRAAGYEQELDYTLDELMALRKRMIDCQNQGQCARP